MPGCRRISAQRDAASHRQRHLQRRWNGEHGNSRARRLGEGLGRPRGPGQAAAAESAEDRQREAAIARGLGPEPAARSLWSLWSSGPRPAGSPGERL
jgi:hypothetical protein